MHNSADIYILMHYCAFESKSMSVPLQKIRNSTWTQFLEESSQST